MKYLLIVLLLSPVAIIAQDNNILKIGTKSARNTKFASGWIPLDSNWKFKPGDNLDWAKPGFNDSSWQSINLFQDLYNVPGIPKNGIAWFRLRLETDSTLLNQQLILRIYQTGASEVYLDGKLIHQLGNVSTNRDSVKYYSPNTIPLSFPLLHNLTQTLAIRFAIIPNRYPVYSIGIKSNLECWVTTLDNGSDDNLIRYIRVYNNRMNIGIGVATVLCILYLSFFLFFPAQKINLYFSLSNFFFALFLFINTININYHGAAFKFEVLLSAFIATNLILFLYCIYKIFNQKPGWIYYSLLAAGIISVPASFLIDSGLISICLGIVVLIDTLRICFRSLSTNKSGAWIILISAVINLTYWIFNLMSSLDIIHIPDMDSYVPLAFLINPLGLAIYLGYAFGMTSQTLRQKLAQVKQLSDEKQQILSAQNETLERQVKERTSELNQSLENLKATQSQLIQSEKMASLGELTAGIAHEIQNPLNFVNNFSEVNTELIEELKGERQKAEGKRNPQLEDDLLNDLSNNMEKINHHGKRADAIVKGMLQHSRSSSGVKEPTNINALADEYLRLSYHGLRAKDKLFNAITKTYFDERIGKINIIPQDIGRVLLNLFNNAFYAAVEKKKLTPSATVVKNEDQNEFEPTVTVITKNLVDKVEISVIDNGNGIPQKILDKIFQPFFTTKPTGQGTGLGLSLAYDIIKAHGGELKVETKEGKGSEFIISIPFV